MTTLRQRIRKQGIRCIPWKRWKGEIALMPVSAQTLFKRKGLEIDILEEELRNEGWLDENESLLDVLQSLTGFNRTLNYQQSIGDFPEDWTEEDYIYNLEKGE